MLNIKRNIDDIKRFKEIVAVLSTEGFYFLVEHLNLKRYAPINKRLKDMPNIRQEVRLRNTLEKLGPTFIKFGQMLSVRPDFVPKRYIRELEKLQDEVTPFSYAQAKKIIEQSTGKKLKQIFKTFDQIPIASASISQVHKAKLHSGEVVAVKVKRPEAEDIIRKDLEIMAFFAELLEKKVKGIRKFKPRGVVREFSEWATKEIDFTIEAENIRRFSHNFRRSKRTKIPQVFDKYSNEDIIVMDFIEGVELHKVDPKKVKIHKVMENGFYSVLEQVFVHGLFHADPHPSNVIVLKDNRISFVDFGIVGRFDDRLKDLSTSLFLGITEGDAESVVETLLELGEVDEEIDVERFRNRISDAIYLIKDNPLKNIKISKMLEDVLDISLEFGVKIPKEFVLFGKTIVTLEGMALLYCPDFYFVRTAAPFMEEVIARRYQPKRVLHEGIHSLLGLKRFAQRVPGQTTRVLDKLEKGKIKIEMKDTDIERLSIELDKSSNRLAYGMIIAALLISASLLINIGDPFLFGLPLSSALLFGLAIVLGFVLVLSIFQEK